MAKAFKNLVERMSPESRARIERRTGELAREMALRELRQAKALTQQQIAGTLRMNQAAVSKLEHQSDMYISTLRRFLSAMGGELRIVASFPEGDVAIAQFGDLRTGARKAHT
jgi:transcriptional regulator with XRE-family HTH domain